MLGWCCLLVATTTVMSVQDRIKEHAVLQTLGLRPARVFRLVVIESWLLSTLGGLLGVAGAVLLLTSVGMSIAAEGVTIAFEPSLAMALQGRIGFSGRWAASRPGPRPPSGSRRDCSCAQACLIKGTRSADTAVGR